MTYEEAKKKLDENKGKVMGRKFGMSEICHVLICPASQVQIGLIFSSHLMGLSNEAALKKERVFSNTDLDVYVFEAKFIHPAIYDKIDNILREIK